MRKGVWDPLAGVGGRSGDRPDPAQPTLGDLFSTSERCERCGEKDAQIVSLRATIAAFEEEDRLREERLAISLERTLEGWIKRHLEDRNIWKGIIEACDELRRSGRTDYGMAAIWERLRWHKALRKSDTEPFKLAHAYRSIYSRMVGDLFPAYGGMFKRIECRMDEQKPWEEAWRRQPERQGFDRDPLQ